MTKITEKAKQILGCATAEPQSETTQAGVPTPSAKNAAAQPEPEAKRPNLPFIKYTGTKTIEAVPMPLKEAVQYLRRDIKPASEETNGYLVRYPDGYESWSPRSAFEDAYNVSETFLDRMIIEQEELECKILQATKFKFRKDFRDLSTKEKLMLDTQLEIMHSLQRVLSDRIDYYKNKENNE